MTDDEPQNPHDAFVQYGMSIKWAHSDLLYSVKISDTPSFVYVLFEHQSTNDPWMPLRSLRYVVRILEQWRRVNPDAVLLPQLRFRLDDISKVTDAELRSRELSVFGTLLLAALRDARHGDKILKTLTNMADLVRALS